MPTLSEYEKLSNDVVKAGVLLGILTGDSLMPFLDFKPIEGNTLTYNRELTLPTTATYSVGSDISETEATYDQKTAALTILAVQSPLDIFAQQTRSNIQDQKAVLFAGMAKSLGRKISQLMIQGEPEATSTHFEGLDSLVRSETRMMAMDDGNVDGAGAAETELTIDRLDAMIDEIKDGQQKPDLLLMNSTMRRKLTSLSRASGSGVVMDSIEMFGHKINTFDSIPIVVSNWITNAEQYNDSSTWPSSTATTIFALQMGEEKQGFTVLHNGPVLNVDIQDIGIKEKRNENLYRMVVYLQTATFSVESISALGGIDSAA